MDTENDEQPQNLETQTYQQLLVFHQAVLAEANQKLSTFIRENTRPNPSDADATKKFNSRRNWHLLQQHKSLPGTPSSNTKKQTPMPPTNGINPQLLDEPRSQATCHTSNPRPRQPTWSAKNTSPPLSQSFVQTTLQPHGSTRTTPFTTTGPMRCP